MYDPHDKKKHTRNFDPRLIDLFTTSVLRILQSPNPEFFANSLTSPNYPIYLVSLFVVAFHQHIWFVQISFLKIWDLNFVRLCGEQLIWNWYLLYYVRTSYTKESQVFWWLINKREKNSLRLYFIRRIFFFAKRSLAFVVQWTFFKLFTGFWQQIPNTVSTRYHECFLVLIKIRTCCYLLLEFVKLEDFLLDPVNILFVLFFTVL